MVTTKYSSRRIRMDTCASKTTKQKERMQSNKVQNTKDVKNDDKLTVKQWLAIRKQAGLQIDPKTAEVIWECVRILDPYGVEFIIPEKYQQIGQDYFARSPGSDVWVWEGDLPDKTRRALEKRQSKLPADLDDFEMWDEE